MNVYVSLATREYGQGRICIHTDHFNGLHTGHGSNPVSFWRKLFEWTSGKEASETINVLVINNTGYDYTDGIQDLLPIYVKNIPSSRFILEDLTNIHCIYFVGLPSSVSSLVTNKIKTFVNLGGGLILESPNRGGEYINLLSGIDNVYCESSNKPLATMSYWTSDGGSSYFYNESASLSFSTTLMQDGFSSSWIILASNIVNDVSKTQNTNEYVYDFSAGSEFSVSYLTSMQKGVVILDYEEYSSTSVSSIADVSSSTSSVDYSSTSSEISEWDLCDNLLAQWKMNDNTSNPKVKEEINDQQLDGIFYNSSDLGEGVENTNLRSSSGKISRSLSFNANSGHYVRTQPTNILNISNGYSDGPFTISLWVYQESYRDNDNIMLIWKGNGYPSCSSGTDKCWALYLYNHTALRFEMYNDPSSNGYNNNYVYSIYGADLATTNEWHNVIVSYGGLANPSLCKIYIDGVASIVSASKDARYQCSLYQESPITISAQYKCSTGDRNGFDGKIDSIMIFNKYFTQKDVDCIFNRGFGTENCSGIYGKTSSSSSSSSSSSYVEEWSLSSNSSSSSSSLSSEYVYWDICDNIISQWNMNDYLANNNVLDTYNRLNCSIYNNGSSVSTISKHVTGKINGALNINTATYTHIISPSTEIGNVGTSCGDSPISIAFWVKFSDFGIDGTSQPLIYKGSGWNTGYRVWQIDIYKSSPNIQFRFIINNDSPTGNLSTIYAITYNVVLAIGDWNFVVVQYDGVSLQNGIKIFLNGEDIVQYHLIDPYYEYPVYGNSYPIVIGSVYGDGSLHTINYDIDNVIILDRIMTQHEIHGLLNDGLGTEECYGEYVNESSSS